MADRTTTDAAEARARLCETLSDADQIESMFCLVKSDDIRAILTTAEAASGAGEREANRDMIAGIIQREAFRPTCHGAALDDVCALPPRPEHLAAADAVVRYIASLPPATDPAIPAGWKLVPEKLTDEMAKAAIVAWLQAQSGVRLAREYAFWSAALAAAPTIPATGDGDRKSMTAEWCLNMARLEEGQEVGAGMPDHPLRLKCELPPAGWLCTREPGHVGPCATIPATGHAATEGEGNNGDE